MGFLLKSRCHPLFWRMKRLLGNTSHCYKYDHSKKFWGSRIVLLSYFDPLTALIAMANVAEATVFI